MDVKHRSTVTVFIWGNFPRDGREALFHGYGVYLWRNSLVMLRCLSRGNFPHDGREALFHGYGVYQGGNSLVMDEKHYGVYLGGTSLMMDAKHCSMVTVFI